MASLFDADFDADRVPVFLPLVDLDSAGAIYESNPPAVYDGVYPAVPERWLVSQA